MIEGAQACTWSLLAELVRELGLGNRARHPVLLPLLWPDQHSGRARHAAAENPHPVYGARAVGQPCTTCVLLSFIAPFLLNYGHQTGLFVFWLCGGPGLRSSVANNSGSRVTGMGSSSAPPCSDCVTLDSRPNPSLPLREGAGLTAPPNTAKITHDAVSTEPSRERAQDSACYCGGCCCSVSVMGVISGPCSWKGTMTG